MPTLVATPACQNPLFCHDGRFLTTAARFSIMPARESRSGFDKRIATCRADFNRYSLTLARSHILIIRDYELRRDLAPDMLVDVEILDVTEEAPRKMVRRISSKSEKA